MIVVAEELAWLGSVARTLSIDVRAQTDTDRQLLPASVAIGFDGIVEMEAPQLFVEVCVKTKEHLSSSDDYDDDDDDDDNRGYDSNEDDGRKCHLVPSRERRCAENYNI